MRLLGALASLTLASAMIPSSYRLIALNDTFRAWMSPREIEALTKPGQLNQFIDVTDFDPATTARTSFSNGAIPTRPRLQLEVRSVFSESLCQPLADCTSTLWATDLTLSAYHTRHYMTQTGRDAVLWLEEQYRQAAGSRVGQDVTITIVSHSWLQPSLIVRVRGTDRPDEVAIVGGHIDSVAGAQTARSPGFDDDGSGSSTVFAAFKALMDHGWTPERTVEFHAYAAEEAGLRGSNEVAADYARRNVDVITMAQFDMTCYSPQRRVGMTSDFTNPQLTSFLGALISEYTDMGQETSRCGYGCSDHASWHSRGYAAAFPFEARFGSHNPNIHTARDTEVQCNRQYMGQFARLATAYAVEMGSLLP